jgi:hypothetical protein
VTNDDTLVHRPAPKRPQTGWQAWQATVGYIHNEYTPDAILTLTAYPVTDGATGWSASLYWESKAEAVHNEETIAGAMRALWLKVEAHHKLFKSLDAAVRRPVNYADSQWLDEATQDALDRLLQMVEAVSDSGWRLAITYQAVDNPDVRVCISLYAQDGTLQTEASGPSLRDACQNMYRSAARYFRRRAQ